MTSSSAGECAPLLPCARDPAGEMALAPCPAVSMAKR